MLGHICYSGPKYFNNKVLREVLISRLFTYKKNPLTLDHLVNFWEVSRAKIFHYPLFISLVNFIK